MVMGFMCWESLFPIQCYILIIFQRLYSGQVVCVFGGCVGRGQVYDIFYLSIFNRNMFLGGLAF